MNDGSAGMYVPEHDCGRCFQQRHMCTCTKNPLHFAVCPVCGCLNSAVKAIVVFLIGHRGVRLSAAYTPCTASPSLRGLCFAFESFAIVELKTILSLLFPTRIIGPYALSVIVMWAFVTNTFRSDFGLYSDWGLCRDYPRPGEIRVKLG